MNINLRGQSFIVDADFEESIGVYGSAFWKKVGSSNYELDTFKFIEKSYSKGKRKFIDIGAATGCMSLFAASIGYDVVALEPQSEIFQALQRNISLNDALIARINCIEALLISDYRRLGEREFFTLGTEGPLSTLAGSLKTIEAKELLKSIDNSSGYSLKMDIEGAEFSLLRDENLLHLLKRSNSILFLSFHPGFQKPLRNNAGLGKKTLWRLATLQDTAKFVFLLNRFAHIAFKNEDKLLSKFQVILRIIRGDRDFTLYF